MDDADGSADTRRAIMEATYRAVRERGYADLTVQAIADEFEKSKAAIHYHYDTKDDLLAAFLEYLIDRFDEEVGREGADDPEERLAALLDALVYGAARDADREGLHAALLELRAQALHEEAFRAQFTENYRAIHAAVAGAVRDGVATGAFRADADPDRVATHAMAAAAGARLYDATVDVPGVRDAVRESLERDVVDDLRAGE